MGTAHTAHNEESRQGEEFWNELYQEREQLWSGEPNAALVHEASDLRPGRALDVGCGEGGDAAWLAGRGWQVTASDISSVALARAAESAPAGITWHHGDLTVNPPPPAAFDLVSLQYFPLPLAIGAAGVRGLLDAVAPGGTLVVTGHDMAGHEHKHKRFNPADYHTPHQVAELLGAEWEVLVLQARPRLRRLADGSAAPDDIVLRARRRA